MWARRLCPPGHAGAALVMGNLPGFGVSLPGMAISSFTCFRLSLEKIISTDARRRWCESSRPNYKRDLWVSFYIAVIYYWNLKEPEIFRLSFTISYLFSASVSF